MGQPYALREVDMNPMIIYQYSLHFKVGLLTSLLVLKLNKSVLKAIAGSLVSDNFA